MKVPDHVMTIVDADGDEWHRCTKYADDADPLVWRHDLGNLPPATLGWIRAVHGPITWDQAPNEAVEPMTQPEHFLMPPEQRRLELRLMQAVALLKWSDTSEHRAMLDDALNSLADYSGSLAHLLADLDQALDCNEDALLDHQDKPQWIPRTWADVRRGDTVRMPGTEHTATIADRYVSTSDDKLGRGRHVIAGPRHWDDLVVRPGECWLVFEGESTPRNMDAAKPVEILMSAAEVEASRHISDWWETRMEIINDA